MLQYIKVYEQIAFELIPSQPYEEKFLAKEFTSDFDSG